ncbi:MAG: helix-turn-helix transcriptional regulator [Acidobacteriota bacterium]
MKDIKQLQTVTIDHGKLKQLRGSVNRAAIGEQIGVSANQIANIENGLKNPSAKGLLRLMMLYGVRAEDIAVSPQ